jgi:tocopherol O-methyltransferase
VNQTSLNQRIQAFYDASSPVWESIWGEHMHHGYYETQDSVRTKDRRQAQIDLIEQLLLWGKVTQASRILDLGCGIGGSSLELAQRFQAQVTGITLSPFQVKRAQDRSKAAGLADQTQFLQADALALPFADQSFDLVWSLESGEHMADKRLFLEECYRVLTPGGQLLMATWCHRPEALSLQDQKELEQIYQVYCLPYVISLAGYKDIAHEIGFREIEVADWSNQVAPFWQQVIRSALTPRALWLLLTQGRIPIQAALALPLMRRGYASGLIRYGILMARR